MSTDKPNKPKETLDMEALEAVALEYITNLKEDKASENPFLLTGLTEEERVAVMGNVYLAVSKDEGLQKKYPEGWDKLQKFCKPVEEPKSVGEPA